MEAQAVNHTADSWLSQISFKWSFVLKQTNKKQPTTTKQQTSHKILLFHNARLCTGEVNQLGGCATLLASCASKLTYLYSQKVNASIQLLTLQLTCIPLAKGLPQGTSLSLVNVITVASQCQVLAKDKLKGRSTTDFWESICHGKHQSTFSHCRFFLVKREVQNTCYKTSNHLKFACLWGGTSFVTESRKRPNSDIQASVTIRGHCPSAEVWEAIASIVVL